MRTIALAAGLAAVLLVSGPVAAQEGYVTTVEEALAIAPDATTVRVRLGSTDVLRTVIERAPGIETLVVHHPGNKLDPEALPLLSKLSALRSLSLGGDPFLYDDEFAALGRLSQLRSLDLSLP